jgi:NADH-quinone oxidoreductase subunit G
VQKRGMKIAAVAPFATPGLTKLRAAVIQTAPGQEADALSGLDDRLSGSHAVILVGERLAESPGGLSAAVSLAERTGAKLAWIPRRAGDRGAVETGCLPGLLPFGRPILDEAARAEIATAWGGSIPAGPGRNSEAIVADAAAGNVALVVGGVDPADLPDPALALRALEEAPFVVSLEIRESAVTDRADVVFPVVPTVEKAGHFLDWEGRLRPFDETLESTGGLPDHRVLHTLAAELGVDLGTPNRRTTQARHLGCAGVKQSSPPGTSCSTTGGCRKPNRISPGPASRRWQRSTRRLRRQSARPRASRSPSAPTTVRSRCRLLSPRCRIRWFGFRRTRRARTC